MNDYEGLEDNCPGRVPQPMCHGSEDLCDSRITGTGCDEDVLDILGFRSSKLQNVSWVSIVQVGCGLALIFVPPFTDFSKECDIFSSPLELQAGPE